MEIKTYQLALLGFGNVGKALASLLLAKESELRQLFGVSFRVTGIATGRHGIAIDPAGIDLERALLVEDLSRLSKRSAEINSMNFIQQCQANVLFENTPVNYETGQPAVDHLRHALECGMHAITANKGPVVHAFEELTDLAREKGKKFLYESTVMDGAPIFSLFREALPGANLVAFKGILNSTTNMILTRMEGGASFKEAVEYCQEIGIAETDPSGDVDGWDAAVKIAALATVLFNTPLKPHQVERQGIRSITYQDVQDAKMAGKRWKLVCEARRLGDRVIGRVNPELVLANSPLYEVTGTTSLIQFETDVLGLLTLIESDPGPHTTAYGLFADLLNAIKSE